MKKLENTAKSYDLRVQGNSRELGELQFAVLQAVAEKRYGDGVGLLKAYEREKGNYPAYTKRTNPVFRHIVELINGIEAKKNVPNLTTLAPNKQEEIQLKVLENWEELKIFLRRIKSIEREMAMADARSSVWVLKALMFSFVVIMTVFLVNEAFRTFGGNLTQFLRDSFQLVIDSANSLF